MYNVVGVRFKKAGKIYYFDPIEFDLEVGQYVIVETARGIEYGKVVVPVKQVAEGEVILPLKQVVRPADERDSLQVEGNLSESKEAFAIATTKISEHKLEMKLVDVEYTFDRNKIIFYFTAEGRVDFRDLVKDLASIFRTRIELRQIGVRDEAKLLGGIGPCGRMLCCSTFLGDFEPVSIKMAKDQNLSLNPSKISGLCGRLMCCLKYENDDYEEAKAGMPDIGEFTKTPDGKGKVVGLNVLERLIQVQLKETDRVVEYALQELLDWEKNLI
ncbi:PSP1 domain-containing protein [Caryophanon latum]|uniref:Stage 0 sporulation protein n=1 Tax=Caryophanon latum TaxID=33977 RepID=A0A1C0Z350_9BACL|nr:stage 0 sporulation family protein [Caryophanon latum]OCS93879.1 stage 0 sporulation protein [Caryophanon latum]